MWFYSLLKNKNFLKEFPGGPVFRTQRFDCGGPGSVSCWGTKILQATRHSQKKIFFLKTIFLRAVLSSQQSWEEGLHRNFPVPPYPHTCIASAR